MSILPYPFQHSPATLTKLIQHLLPPGSCLLCGADALSNAPLCQGCIGDLPLMPAARCPQCSIVTTHGEYCGACLHRPPHFDRCHALFPYDFPADRLIQALKYGHQLLLAPWFGEQLATHLQPSASDLIIPLPLHPERLCQRGFNQSGEIAATLGKCLKLPVDRRILIRNRATHPQAELAPKERLANVRGAFECLGDLSGQRILLIDDVLTTGATANECARVLKLHGARQVEVMVVARAFRH